MLNHTGDEDLRNFIKDMIKAGKEEAEQIEQLLKENGVLAFHRHLPKGR